MKILFILKFRENGWGSYSCGHLSSGLHNSAKFVVDMLNHSGIHAKLVQIRDNNEIDKEVHRYKPTHVIIEAVWVVPEKFKILKKLHPKVKWIVRNHSEIPFLASEGLALSWMLDYAKHGIHVACNSKKMARDFDTISGRKDTLLLPNYYPVHHIHPECEEEKCHIDVGCFGALRLLKNQLIQAIAAYDAVVLKMKKKLFFHINATRIEHNSDTVLKNLRNLFEKLPDAYLVEHPWHEHEKFLEVVRDMDIGLQVSFTETFNIVAANFVGENRPVIVSKEIEWLPNAFQVKNATCSEEISEKIIFGLRCGENYKEAALEGLRRYSHESKRLWLKHFE